MSLISKQFHDIDMDLDDEIYIYQMDSMKKSKNYELFEVYKIFDGGSPQINKVGDWYSDTKMLDFTNQDKNIRRRNLKVRQQHLKADSESQLAQQHSSSRMCVLLFVKSNRCGQFLLLICQLTHPYLNSEKIHHYSEVVECLSNEVISLINYIFSGCYFEMCDKRATTLCTSCQGWEWGCIEVSGWRHLPERWDVW